LDNGVWKEEKLFFLYDGSNEIGALDHTGTIVQLRVLASGSHAEIGAAIGIELNGQVFAPLHDLQGNVESLISLDTKQPVAAYRYSAFGEEQIGGGGYSLLSTTGSVLIDTACFKNPITSWNYYSNQSFGWVGQTYDWMD